MKKLKALYFTNLWVRCPLGAAMRRRYEPWGSVLMSIVWAVVAEVTVVLEMVLPPRSTMLKVVPSSICPFTLMLSAVWLTAKAAGAAVAWSMASGVPLRSTAEKRSVWL